jgi:LEA14-like dessication related protein
MSLQILARWHRSRTVVVLAAMLRRFVLGFVLAASVGAGVLSTGCQTGKSPELRVLGVHEEPRKEIVFVQVTNPARHPMRLTKLEYRFAADGATLSAGEMRLAHEVPAGAAVVVEIPLDAPSERPMTLSGKLTAELDKIVRIFAVSAQIRPSK